MPITKDAILKVARLSRLKLNEEDVDYHQNNLGAIFKWIDQLENVDVSSVELNVGATTPLMHEREDVVTEANLVKEVLINSPSAMHEMYSVPKVVE